MGSIFFTLHVIGHQKYVHGPVIKGLTLFCIHVKWVAAYSINYVCKLNGGNMPCSLFPMQRKPIAQYCCENGICALWIL